jgi:hypothetical protein
MARSKLGRNDPCTCGSGRKVKRCCGGQRRSTLDHPPALGDHEPDSKVELRAFEVIEVQEGLGYRVMELGDEPSRPQWVADAEGSWSAAPGTLFAGRFADDAAIRLPGHPDCPLCQAERARRMSETMGVHH